jgi:hypothetical protein
LQRGWVHLLGGGHGDVLCTKTQAALAAPTADTRVLQAFVAVLTAMLLGVTIVWIRLWHTQTTFDDRV